MCERIKWIWTFEVANGAHLHMVQEKTKINLPLATPKEEKQPLQ